MLLDRPLERPRTVGRIVASVGQEHLRPVGQPQRQAASASILPSRRNWISTILPRSARLRL